MFGLLEGPARGWGDPLVLGAVVGGLLLLGVFLLFERRTAQPMVPLSLFRSRTFSGINAITLLLYANLAGLGFFLPLFLIQVRGFSAAAAGAATMPLVILLTVASGWSGRLYDRTGPRLPIAGGAFITAMAFVLFIILKDSAAFWVAVTIPMTIMGDGMAIFVAPITPSVLAAAPAD